MEMVVTRKIHAYARDMAMVSFSRTARILTTIIFVLGPPIDIAILAPQGVVAKVCFWKSTSVHRMGILLF